MALETRQTRTETPPANSEVGIEPAKAARRLTESLSRGLEILRCFSPSKPLLSNKEITLRTGLPKPTVTRLTATLLERGFLRKAADGRGFRLGSASLAVAYPLLANMSIRQLMRRQMQGVADHVGGSVGLSMLERTDMICVESCRKFNAPDFLMDIGAAAPVWAGAEGWAALAGIPPQRRAMLLEEIGRDHSAPYLAHRESIQRGIDSIVTFGYGVSHHGSGATHVSVPLRKPVNGEQMVVTCAIVSSEIRPGWVEQDVGPRLVTAVQNFSASL